MTTDGKTFYVVRSAGFLRAALTDRSEAIAVAIRMHKEDHGGLVEVTADTIGKRGRTVFTIS
jgi:predicted RNA-binding protein YlqC (UPF0109 family)